MDSSASTVETLLSPVEEQCKNSNQLVASITQLQPYQGRNPCLERNLLSSSSDSLLIDKSSKHCTSNETQNLIANDFHNYHIPRAMPIPYLQNAVHDNLKQCNTSLTLAQKSLKFKWSGLKKFFGHKNSGDKNLGLRKETQVKLRSNKLVNSFGQSDVSTSLLNERPSALFLNCAKSEKQKNLSGISQIVKQNTDISTQHSLECFNSVFSSTSDLSRLKDPSQRVKTPGDVPPSVRRTRGRAAKESARFSLCDDRILQGQSHSTPNLETDFSFVLKSYDDRDSISSF